MAAPLPTPKRRLSETASPAPKRESPPTPAEAESDDVTGITRLLVCDASTDIGRVTTGNLLGMMHHTADDSAVFMRRLTKAVEWISHPDRDTHTAQVAARNLIHATRCRASFAVKCAADPVATFATMKNLAGRLFYFVFLTESVRLSHKPRSVRCCPFAPVWTDEDVYTLAPSYMGGYWSLLLALVVTRTSMHGVAPVHDYPEMLDLIRDVSQFLRVVDPTLNLFSV
jgi:hypothetical protein